MAKKSGYRYVPATRRQLIEYAKRLQDMNRKLSFEAAFKQAEADERRRAESYLKNIDTQGRKR